MTKIDVTAICRAYVDLIIKVSDNELAAAGIKKTQDEPSNEQNVKELVAEFGPRGIIMPGGPAANSMAGVGALGGNASFIGKIGDDTLGKAFAQDFQNRGVAFDIIPKADAVTATCLVFVTPDGERSFAYTPGISDDITIQDIERNKAVLENTAILYLGHSNKAESCAEAVELAIRYATCAKIAATLQSYRTSADSIRHVRNIIRADIILGNDEEYAHFIHDLGHDSISAAAQAYPHKIFACTLGEEGAVIYSNQQKILLPTIPVQGSIDTTGAGDAWAAGFLFGTARNLSLRKAGELGALCASKILSETGGRPTRDWHSLAAKINPSNGPI